MYLCLPVPPVPGTVLNKNLERAENFSILVLGAEHFSNLIVVLDYHDFRQ
jgi:hypothetical protein